MYRYEKGREWAVGSVPKHGTELWNFLETFGTAVNLQKTVVSCCVEFLNLNSMLVGMRPGIAMEIGFKNWNRCRMSGLPVDSPLPLFRDSKNSPGFV